MKKTLIVLLICLSASAFSQVQRKQASLSVGPSFAVGNFANKFLYEEGVGSAGAGVNVNLFYRHTFLKYLGVGIKLFRNTNKINTFEFADEMNAAYGYDVASKNFYWSAEGLLAGLTAHMPSGKKGSVDFRFFLGPTELHLPISKLPACYKLKPEWWTIPSGKVTFGYNIGTGYTACLFH
jgi:hypothetical protein